MASKSVLIVDDDLDMRRAFRLRLKARGLRTVFAGDGISVEVLDLRSLVPLDREAVVASASKTGRVVVVDEDYRSFGMSGEIAATLAEGGVSLSAPFTRVTYPDMPVPYARSLEQAALPTRARIEAAIRSVVGA